MECRHPNKYIIHIIKNPKKLIQSNSEFLVSKFFKCPFSIKNETNNKLQNFFMQKNKT